MLSRSLLRLSRQASDCANRTVARGLGCFTPRITTLFSGQARRRTVYVVPAETFRHRPATHYNILDAYAVNYL